MCSRLRGNPDKLFEVFAEVGRPEQEGADPFILQKYPPDFDEQDVLNNIPKFSFPCKINTSQVDQFAFVLTDLESLYRFGFCRHGTSAQTCLCIISHLPWYEVFYKMLNFLAEIVNRSDHSDLLPFLTAAYHQSIPLANEPVTIVAGQDMFNFTAPDSDSLPSIPASRNLTEYYNAVDTNNMMRIFASMLHERRIMVTSRKLSRMTACIHAAESLLYPMHWQHLYIPVLPEHLVEYVTAPMPYLIGVHTSLMEKVREKRMEIGDAVIVDADKNEVLTEYEDLEALPEDVSSYLKRHLKTQRVQTSMMDCGDAISRAFLQALVRLIGGYRDALRFPDGEPITFDRDAFVQSRSSQSMQVFLENMLHLQIFQQFINGRLELLNDGRGLTELFEQESVKYTDSLNTQSKYKEWLARVSKQKRKLKAGGKDIISDMKERAAPMMNTAVQSMKNQGKKVMSKVKEMNENKMSSRKVTGGIVHARRHTTLASSHLYSSRPPRPSHPSASSQRIPVSGQQTDRSHSYRSHLSVEGEERGGGGVHDDSHLRLSYHSIDVSLMSDIDIQHAMMRSASAENLPPPGDPHHDSSPQSASEGDVSSTPSSEAQSPSDENLSDIPYLNMTSHATPPLPHRRPTTTTTMPPTASSSEEDLLAQPPSSSPHHPPVLPPNSKETWRAGSREGSGVDCLELPRTPLLAGPAPVAPPRGARRTAAGARSAGPSPQTSPQLSRPHPQPPRPSPSPTVAGPGRTSGKPGAEGRAASGSGDARTEKPLIRFESSESEAEGMEQFDPLRSRRRSPEELQASPSHPSSSPPTPPSSQSLTRAKSSRNSLMRSAAFRRSPQSDAPLRSGYRDDDEAEEGGRSGETDLADLFDPLLGTAPAARADAPVPSKASRCASSGHKAGEGEAGGSLMHDWTLAQLTAISSSSGGRPLSAGGSGGGGGGRPLSAGGSGGGGVAPPFAGVSSTSSGFSRVPLGGTLTCPAGGVSAAPPPPPCPFPPPARPLASVPAAAAVSNPLYAPPFVSGGAVRSNPLYQPAASSLGRPRCQPLCPRPTCPPATCRVEHNPSYQLSASLSSPQPVAPPPAWRAAAPTQGRSSTVGGGSLAARHRSSPCPMPGSRMGRGAPPLTTSSSHHHHAPPSSKPPAAGGGGGGGGWETFD